jgi:RNA polymerase sigma factor (TIGR02999 family)
MNDVTQILSQIESGDSSAAENLLPIVYAELRKLASVKLAKENPGQTLQATALVHEAYLRLVDGQSVQHWDSRGHFFSAAAEAMRRILIERARRSRVKERHGQANRIELDENVACLAPSIDLLVFDDLLSELQANEPQAAELVKLRVFAGASHREAAELIGISRRVADRLWRIARAWLSRELKRS